VKDAYQTQATRVHYAELRVWLTATKVEVSKVSSVNVEYISKNSFCSVGSMEAMEPTEHTEEFCLHGATLFVSPPRAKHVIWSFL
jgi:hypothetical protein